MGGGGAEAKAMITVTDGVGWGASEGSEAHAAAPWPARRRL